MASEEKGKKLTGLNHRACSNCLASEGSAGAPKLSACSRCGLVAYCSRDFQRAHWKANHKQHCVAKADRTPQPQNTDSKDSISNAARAGEKCIICMDLLGAASACTLPCTHVFHGACVAGLRKFGVQQVCPLCRIPLPPGPEKVFEEATRRYYIVSQLVERGYASWSALPASAQLEMDAVKSGWRAAADEGYTEAQYCLGFLFEDGHGVAQDPVEAARWYRKAADKGHLEAQCDLGLLFQRGRGVVQNDTEAARWFELAADRGHARAQSKLGFLYENGLGVAKSDAEAVRWYKKSADQGYDRAQCLLGNMYESGNGVVKSDVEAAR